MRGSRALITGARLVPIDTPAAAATAPLDLRVRDGRISQIGPALTREPGEEVHQADGLWAMPGLWDHHVHLGQWALTSQRLDISAATSPAQAARWVGEWIQTHPQPESWHLVQGFGQRPALWDRQPATADLDAQVGAVPVVLISGDAHHGWLSTAAFHLLGVPPREGVLEEEDWWPVFARLSALPGSAELLEAGYRDVLRAAAELGVVGVVDFEMGAGWQEWPQRVAAGSTSLRLRPAVYRQQLAGALEHGLRTGQVLDEHGLIVMGGLKVIYDGSLNTRTALCCQPFADAHDLSAPRGVQNLTEDELRWLLEQAHAAGLEASVHAIGDAALGQVLEAFAATGARGSVEHAQLAAPGDVSRLARLGIRASVQPVHLWDDRDVIDHCWPDRAERCFAFASMQRSGVDLRLGSDAPVAPLDPWQAMAAAVHRSPDDRPPWQSQESLTLAQALAASTDGRGTLRVGDPADLLLLDRNPLSLEGDSQHLRDELRAMRPRVTMVAGQVTHAG